MIKHGHLLDTVMSAHVKRHKWTPEEDALFEELYKQGMKFDDIAEKMGMRINMLNHRRAYLKLGDKYMRPNNPNFKAVYQNYDWCYERYIVKGMSHQEMADECGATLRTIQKWCAEIHNLHGWSFKDKKRLTDRQYQIIMAGTLGDGHIDKRENQPLYIESHSIGEKDYVFWKYHELEDLCACEPKYYPESYTKFGTDKFYLCQPFYRFETRIIMQLKEIRNMNRIEKIKKLNELGLCLHILDDASRGNLWDLCLAEYSIEEIDCYIQVCEECFGLKANKQKDLRYIAFDAPSSRKIDEMILRNLPNDLDIIKKKILNNSNIKQAANYVYVETDEKKIGLAAYCKSHKLPYLDIKAITNSRNITNIKEADFITMLYKEGIANAV